MAHTYAFSTQKAEARGQLATAGQPELCSKFETIQDYRVNEALSPKQTGCQMAFPRLLTPKTKHMLSTQGFSNQDLDSFIALYFVAARATNIHG